jgi:hypothetical protein
VVKLCRYLLQQGYTPDKITILATYGAQVGALADVIKRTQHAGLEGDVTLVILCLWW